MEKLLYQLAEQLIKSSPWLLFGGVLLFYIIKYLMNQNSTLSTKVDELEKFIRIDLLSRNEDQAKVNVGLTALVKQMQEDSKTKWTKVESSIESIKLKLIEIQLKNKD